MKNRRNAIATSLLIAFTLVAGVMLSGARGIVGYRRAFGPTGYLKISEPNISWEVWGGKGDQVTSYQIKIDGQVVPSSYDSTKKLLSYLPNSPLDKGVHSVQCSAEIDGELHLSQSWQFQVLDSAQGNLPQPSDDQTQLLDLINDLRQKQGLSPAVFGNHLAAAAQAHCQYLSDANSYGHMEAPDHDSFVGQSMSDRLNAFGWIGGGYEDVGFVQQGSANHIVRALFDAPYHRIPFLQPGSFSVGTGYVNHRATIEFGFSTDSGIVMSPNDQGIAPSGSWDGIESPNPLAIHGATGQVGYPILLNGFGDENQIVDGSITLEDALAAPIACYLNTPKNDAHLDSQLLAIPTQPLATGWYTVHATFSLKSGANKKLTWKFFVPAPALKV